MLYLLCSKEKFEENKLYNDVIIIIIRMVTNGKKKRSKRTVTIMKYF
jgi:hypothetical protein